MHRRLSTADGKYISPSAFRDMSPHRFEAVDRHGAPSVVSTAYSRRANAASTVYQRL